MADSLDYHMSIYDGGSGIGETDTTLSAHSAYA